MDKKQNETNQENWLDDILGKQDAPKELSADELAAYSAGLTHPDDLELERIVQETLANDFGDTPAAASVAEESAESTRFFTPQQATAEVAPEVPEEVVMQKQDADPKRKERPKKERNFRDHITHFLATVVWLGLILAIGVSAGRTLWLCAADVLALGKTPQEVSVTIEPLDSIDVISEKLQKSGMIRYSKLFKIFAELTGKGDGIMNGTITFSDKTVYDYNALINAMSYRSGALVTVEVMIPEGYSCAQIFDLLEEKGVCSVADLEEYAANGELDDYWFLEDVKRGHKYCLEGFLFPDTYEFYVNDEPERVITKFLDDFEYRFSDRLIDKFVKLNNKLGSYKLSVYELVTMASMVEKEKANNLEGYTIASVYYNRITHPSSFPVLNCDATIIYAKEYYYKDQNVTDALLEDSPYNTYTHRGLPPTPISNPGLSSLDAALEPEDTGYYYYVLNKEAHYHVFSKTYEEHQRKMRELGY